MDSPGKAGPESHDENGAIDTGLNALAMLAQYHGVAANPAQLRHEFAPDGRPFDGDHILHGARHLGLKAKRVRTKRSRLDRTPLPAIAPVPALAASKELRIPFESAQTHVYIGQPGYPRKDPDHFALNLGNYILGGGGFVSRLTDEVREKRGLTYSVYSGFAPGLDAGAFRVGFQTRPDQAAEAVKVACEVLAKFVAEGPTQNELKAAKDNLIGGFPLLLDSNRKLIGNVANIAWNDLPLDYLDTWTARMNAVTAADIKAAFARKLQPDRMVTVVVGSDPQAKPRDGK